MALTGLEIYKLLPKTNCKKCGFPTCLAFAMALAQKKTSLDKCPFVSEEAKKALESASEPPIKLVTIGTGTSKFEIGNETVMFRHEEKFVHQTGIGFLIEADSSDEEIKKAIIEIKKIKFERVGQKLTTELVMLFGKNKDKFISSLKLVKNRLDKALILINDDIGTLKSALEITKDVKPLIGYCTKGNVNEICALSKEYNVPLLARAETIEKLEELVKDVTSKGVKEIVLSTHKESLSEKLWELTQARRLALKKNFRPFGYPFLVTAPSTDLFEETCYAVTFVSKYAGICIIKNREASSVLSILTARQNIYTDPQKPLQVEPRIYEVGKVGKDSPVLATTNFSLTYYTVESEVEASKRGSYIISCDTEGMSVLTAWAAEKFTGESIAKAIKESGIEEKVSHKKLVIPGYVSVLSGKIQEASGWKVSVGPKEASGLPLFLKNL